MTLESQETPTPAQASLSDHDVKRITAEERLRNRLRSEFELEAKDKKPGWSKFLNSPFGLFLLGSVLLSGLTGIHTKAQYNSRQAELRNQDIFKATTELQYRLHQIERYSSQMKQAAPGNKVAASRFIWYTVYGGPEYYHASVPEFAGVTTYGLIGRLRLLGVTDGTEGALKSVIALEDGQTQPDGGQTVYPQEFLDSHVQTLSDYSDHVLIPIVDKERSRSLIARLLF